MNSLTKKIKVQPIYRDNVLDAYIPELWAQEGLAILEENINGVSNS